jgi:hypothetical protein
MLKTSSESGRHKSPKERRPSFNLDVRKFIYSDYIFKVDRLFSVTCPLRYPLPPECRAGSIDKQLIQIIAYRVAIAGDGDIDRHQKSDSQQGNEIACKMRRDIENA